MNLQPTEQAPARPHHWIRSVAIPGLLVFLLVLGAFWPATDNDFVNYDDPVYVVDNPAVQKGLTVDSLRWAFTTGHAANWHPLTWISHMVDCKLFGLQPRGHHATSVLLHALAALVAFLAIRQLTGATPQSLIVALLFGLHPLRVESVAWVAERKDVLSTLFWMLGLWAYALRAQRISVKRSGGSIFYLLTLACMAAGLMSKVMLVTFPFTLLLIDYWPLRRWDAPERATATRLFLEKVPFFLLSMAASIVTFLVQRQAGAVKDGEMFPLGARVENALLAYSLYLAKFFYPVHLAVYYPHPTVLPLAISVLCAAFLLGITAIVIWQRTERPWLIVGWLWYLGTLFPTIGLVQVGTQAMADRYTYVPLLGISIALIWTVGELATRLRLPKPATAAFVAVAVLACVTITESQIRFWKDSETLFRHAVAVTETNSTAHVNLGIALDRKGAHDDAIAELETALKIDPASEAAHLNLGVILGAVGRIDEALDHLQRAVELNPRQAEAHFCLGKALASRNRVAEAMAEYEEALRVNPDYVDAHVVLGTVLYSLRRYDKALTHFQYYLRLNPTSAMAQDDVGSVLTSLGRLSEAVPYYRAALRLDPGNSDARQKLDDLLKSFPPQQKP
ncbi:MAG TPA: tetratricopeptide repeat protein [Chthoniobacter sp.]